MDIERINTTLNRAIAGLQGGEIEAMLEAMAHGVTSFNVPSLSRMRSSYRPPSPASMGFVPGKKKKGKALRWKKGTIQVAVNEGKKATPGLIKGVWGVHKNLDRYGGWNVTHIPSGLALRRSETKAFCQQYIDTIADEKPELLREKSTDRLQKLGNTIWSNIAKSTEERIRQKKAESAIRREEQKKKDMALEPSEMGTDKWKKATFNAGVGERKEKAVGSIRGVWGVTKDKAGWKVIHLPSGLALVQTLDTKKRGVSAVDEMVEKEPSILYHKSENFTGKLKRVMVETAQKYRRYGRHY